MRKARFCSTDIWATNQNDAFLLTVTTSEKVEELFALFDKEFVFWKLIGNSVLQIEKHYPVSDFSL